MRAHLDARSEKVGYKIREAQAEKVPYMLVIGAKEVTSDTVRVRHRSGEDRGPMSVEAFVAMVTRESDLT